MCNTESYTEKEDKAIARICGKLWAGRKDLKKKTIGERLTSLENRMNVIEFRLNQACNSYIVKEYLEGIRKVKEGNKPNPLSGNRDTGCHKENK